MLEANLAAEREARSPLEEQANARDAELRAEIAALEAELADEIAALESKFDAGAIVVEQSAIKARKSDTAVADLALVWQPA